MNPTKSRSFALLGVAVLATIGGVTYASADSPDPAAAPSLDAQVSATARPLDPQVAETVSVLKSSHDPVTAEMLREFASAPSDSPVAHIDYSRAHAFAVAHSSDTGWIAPSGGAVCTIIADPAGGYGAACDTVDQIKAGLSTTVLGGRGATGIPAGQSIVIQIVPDGAASPRITTSNGAHTLTTTGNVAAELGPSGGTLQAGPNTRALIDPATIKYTSQP